MSSTSKKHHPPSSSLPNSRLLSRKRKRSACPTDCPYAFHKTTTLLSLEDWRWIQEEARALLRVAWPTVIVQLSFVVPPFLASSHIGRTFGVLHLDAFTIAWGAGNLSTLALLQGVFNAVDTLAPRAFGAEQYREVGLVAIRGFATTLLVILPVNAVLWMMLGPLLQFLGQDAEATKLACQFYGAYMTSYPLYSCYEMLWKFLAAQNKLIPMVVSTLVGTFGLLPLLLPLFLRWFGFVGAGFALTCFYLIESVTVIAWLWWLKPHHPETWPGLSSTVLKEALASNTYWGFLTLSFGGMLAYLEWVYWEILTVLIGAFDDGVLALSAHTVPRQLTDMLYVFPLGLAIALAIRLGATLPKSATKAKRLASGTYACSVVVFGLPSLLMYVFRDAIILMFTTDSRVIAIANDIWLHACLYLWFFSLFGVSSGISIGLGDQTTFGLVTTLIMWCVGMPITYYFAVMQKGGLTAVWKCIWPPYLAVNLTMLWIFARRDWDEVSLPTFEPELTLAESPNSLGLGNTKGEVVLDDNVGEANTYRRKTSQIPVS